MSGTERVGLESIAESLGEHTARDFFQHVRQRYLDRQSEPELTPLLDKVAAELAETPENLWASQRFQLLFRATKPEHLRILGVNGELFAEAKRAVAAGRKMSILPYNTVMGEGTIKKYTPTRSEKFSGNWRHSIDPYGIFKDQARIKAIDEEGNETYLATRKFPYAVLANITEACHIGCDGCYKGSMVRTAEAALAEIYPEYAKIKRALTQSEAEAARKAELLAEWLNENPEVDTIVVSGGEPLLFSNQGLEHILDAYSKAEHVDVVRICTSAVYQGMWYRIDDEFIQILTDFEDRTGKRVHLNTHVTDEHQLDAPEARETVKKLKRNGIDVYLQMPVQEGINFHRDDLEATVEQLRRISKAAYRQGAIPYKMIVDMHSPSDPSLTVPIETFAKAIAFLDQHSEHSDEERWQAYNILHEQGNLYMQSHLVGEKEIDRINATVTYFLPVRDQDRVAVHTYTEPLISGHNDDPNSVNKVANPQTRERIATVKQAYQTLNAQINRIEQETSRFQERAERIGKWEREFYQLSGITFAYNQPIQGAATP